MGRKRDMQIADMVGKPISAKMDQLEQAVRKDGEQTRNEYKKQIGEIKKVVDVMVEDLSSREKKELYDLNTLIDISTLEETEKRFLVEALYTLAGMTEQITETQQAFIRSVQNYLGIKNVQTMINLAAVENIENIRTQKALLQTIMEFLFLENNDHRYISEYDDIFSYFSVNKKGIKDIENAINNIYIAVGEQGLAEKYGYVVENGQSNQESMANNDIAEVKKILKTWYEQEFVFLEGTFALARLTGEYDAKMYYMEEDIKSMSTCKRKAEEILKCAYTAANSLLSTYSSDGLCYLLGKEFFEKLESDITKIQHHLRNLRSIGADNEKIDSIMSYIEPDKIRDSIKDTLQQELNDRYYHINDFSDYAKSIECTEWDMTGADAKGLWKLLATAAGNVYYSFDCSNAWHEIDNDITARVEQFEKSSVLALQRALTKKHIEPSEFLLDEVQKILNNECDKKTL